MHQLHRSQEHADLVTVSSNDILKVSRLIGLMLEFHAMTPRMPGSAPLYECLTAIGSSALLSTKYIDRLSSRQTTRASIFSLLV